MYREAACFLGERNGGANRVDTNCQRRRITLKVTLVLDRCGKALSDEKRMLEIVRSERKCEGLQREPSLTDMHFRTMERTR